jgi:hypothetical protein
VKRLLEEIGIPELTPEQLEKLCEIGEKTARTYVLSKVSSRKISTFNIFVDVEGTKPVTVDVDVEINLSPLMQDYEVEPLVKEATEKAFESIKKYLSELACKSTK